MVILPGVDKRYPLSDLTLVWEAPMSGRPLARWLGTTGAVLAVSAAITLVAVTPAAAAGPTGYVRLAHLSPDTPNVDVYLSTVGGSGAPQGFPGVGDGGRSQYLSVPTRTYP